MNGDFSPIVAGLGLADENARLKQQLAELRADKEADRAYVEGLEQEAKLNASMLARQTDLAREAETARDQLSQALSVQVHVAEAQLASEKQQHQIMDAAYWAAKEQLAEEHQTERRRWHENYERETRRVVELLEERGRLIMAAEDKDAALGVLAGVLSQIEYVPGIMTGARFCPWCGEHSNKGHTDSCKRQKALAPEAVQRAIEAWRAKDAKIEHLQQLLHDAPFATFDTASDAETRLVSRVQESEAKLAVATGLLRVFAECKCCPASFESDAFLADPSQAAAEYREALAVVERVKDDVLLGSLLLAVADPRSGVSDSHKVSVQYVQAMLLGDAAQEEKP